ncbi:MAG: LacI family DNA-binding transcriptional regulator [Rhodobacteraceae bacterium]|nr:LacI family DNA-binding transcriptional regulator [Paracoccaceae bacterium]
MSVESRKSGSVTSFDVAHKAGVSRSAVSRAFTPGSSISEKTRSKIQKAAAELGYRVNLVARGLNKQRTDIVGVIVSALNTPYRAGQIDALTKQLVREGFRPMLLCVDEDKDVEQLLSILLNYQVSGVIITSDAPPNAICEECARMQVPLVLVHRTDQLPFVDRINGDDIKGGRMAAEALVKAGRQHLIAVRQEAPGFTGVVRIDAFLKRADELGVTSNTITISAVEYDGGVAAAPEVLNQLDVSPGVFCHSDLFALGLLDTLRNKHSIRIPEQMSVIGYDDIPQASWAFADLTTIRQSPNRFAQVTVDLLKHRIKYPESEPKNEIVDVTLVMRGSV